MHTPTYHLYVFPTLNYNPWLYKLSLFFPLQMQKNPVQTGTCPNWNKTLSQSHFGMYRFYITLILQYCAMLYLHWWTDSNLKIIPIMKNINLWWLKNDLWFSINDEDIDWLKVGIILLFAESAVCHNADRAALTRDYATRSDMMNKEIQQLHTSKVAEVHVISIRVFKHVILLHFSLLILVV